MKEEKGYFVQAQHKYEFEFDATDIYEAAKIAIDKIKEKEIEEGIEEKAGTDISMRIWQIYGNGAGQ